MCSLGKIKLKQEMKLPRLAKGNYNISVLDGSGVSVLGTEIITEEAPK